MDASGARRDGQGTVSPSLRQINEEAAQWAAFLFWLAAIAAGTTGLNRRCRRGRSNGPPADGARSAASHLRRSSPRTQAPTNASPMRDLQELKTMRYLEGGHAMLNRPTAPNSRPRMSWAVREREGSGVTGQLRCRQEDEWGRRILPRGQSHVSKA